MGDVPRKGDRKRADAEPGRPWGVLLVLLPLAYVVAFVIIAAINVPVLNGREAEAKRLRRDGVEVQGTISWSDSTRRGWTRVGISYGYQGRGYRSSAYCPGRGCAPSNVVALWVDPQRPGRFATEHGEINDGVDADSRSRLVIGFALSSIVLSAMIFIGIPLAGRQPRRGRARARRRRGF